MRILMDYKCRDCGTITERFLEAGTKLAECKCGGISDKIIGLPTVMLDGTNPDYPGAYDKWARTREQNARVTAKRNS